MMKGLRRYVIIYVDLYDNNSKYCRAIWLGPLLSKRPRQKESNLFYIRIKIIHQLSHWWSKGSIWPKGSTPGRDLSENGKSLWQFIDSRPLYKLWLKLDPNGCGNRGDIVNVFQFFWLATCWLLRGCKQFWLLCLRLAFLVFLYFFCFLFGLLLNKPLRVPAWIGLLCSQPLCSWSRHILSLLFILSCFLFILSLILKIFLRMTAHLN